MFARKALAGTAGAPKVYVEDVFSTYLYTGTAASNTISNSIDLSGEGGLLWIKNRGDGGQSHVLIDSARGTTKALCTSATAAEETLSGGSVTFNNNGFNISAGVFSGEGNTNANTNTYASWTFRKAEKFFDVVTWTGDGTSGRSISHSLGSTPGCIIIKRYDSGSFSWLIFHRSLQDGLTGSRLVFDTAAATNGLSGVNIQAADATTITLGSVSTNTNGGSFVAYLFAHDAGGFGDAGSDNVISCGSFTSSGTGTGSASLGFEPQFLIVKAASGATGDWWMLDVMREASRGNTQFVSANSSSAESSFSSGTSYPLFIEQNGFSFPNASSLANNATYIYIAIRRGPMKTPTTGTSVFGDTYASVEPVSTNLTTESGVLADLVIHGLRISGTSFGRHWMSRLTGNNRYLVSSSTDFETSPGTFWKFDNNNYAYIPPSGYANNNGTGTPYVAYSFKRAPKFFDVVCYTGTGANRTVSHNLGVAPELVILKRRNSAEDWSVLQTNIPTQATLNGTFSGDPPNSSYFGNGTSYVAPTSTVFSVGTNSAVNASGGTYVAYLFASLSGVSKVGSYTGNGSSVTVTTNFQPRFILVKRTDSTGDWIVSDSARGLVAGNDPYLELNTADAEVTNEDWVDISSTSFTVNQTTNNANVNTGTYLYLAIS